jgi:hypothetical protein
VARIEYRLALAVALSVLVPGILLAQPPAAQQELTAAATALNSIDPKGASGDAAKAVGTVRKDFEAMQQALSSPPASDPNDWRTKYSAIERDLTSLIGSINTQAGQPAAPAGTKAPQLDPPTRVALEDFRNHIELFYAGMMNQSSSSPAASAAQTTPPTAPGAPTPPAPASAAAGSLSTGAPPPTAATTGTSIPREAAAAPPQAPQSQPATMPQAAPGAAGNQPAPAAQSAIDAEGAAALLDRMETILNTSLGHPPANREAVGTSGALPGVDSKSKAGKVSVDRAALDEILAEVEQLRTMLRVKR